MINMFSASVVSHSLFTIMTAMSPIAGNQWSPFQPEETPAATGLQEPGKPDELGWQEKWDPTLQYDYTRLKERLESILATESKLGLLIAYWELVLDTHRAVTTIYHGDRAVLTEVFFLLAERLPDGGWILLDSEDPGNDRKVFEIPADGGVYIIRKNQLIRVGEVEDGDVVFVATKGGAGVIGIDGGLIDVGVIPSSSEKEKSGKVVRRENCKLKGCAEAGCLRH